MSMCRVVSCCWKRVFATTSGKTRLTFGKPLLAFALLHFVLQGQTCLLFQGSLEFLLLDSGPLCWNIHLFLVLVLGGLGSHYRTIQLQLPWNWCWGTDFALNAWMTAQYIPHGACCGWWATHGCVCTWVNMLSAYLYMIANLVRTHLTWKTN